MQVCQKTVLRHFIYSLTVHFIRAHHPVDDCLTLAPKQMGKTGL